MSLKSERLDEFYAKLLMSKYSEYIQAPMVVQPQQYIVIWKHYGPSLSFFNDVVSYNTTLSIMHTKSCQLPEEMFHWLF